MARVPHRLFRTLQLLALFQLLGGPLVIGSLVMFAKLTRHEHVTLATLPGQVWRAAEQAHSWQNAPTTHGAPSALRATTGTDSRQRPPTAPKPGKPASLEDPAKIAGAFSTHVPTAAEHLMPEVELPPWRAPRLPTHAHPPPSPPPRAA